MSVESILDAIAVKAEAVSGIKKAYGSGAGNTSVARLPDQIADGPVCLVMYEGTEVENSSAFEVLRHTFTADVYVQSQEAGAAYRTLVPFISRFIAEFRTDRDLGGTCTEAHVAGADAIESVEVNGRPYNRLPIRVAVLEMSTVTTSV